MLRIITLFIVVLAYSSITRAGDYRAPRELVFSGTPVTVFVWFEKRTEVVFPERIVGGLPPTRMEVNGAEAATDGMEWSKGPNLDRLFLLPLVNGYRGTMTIHGESGRSYILYLVADKSPDISVVLQDGKVVQEQLVEQEKKTPRHKLIEWLMRGETPPGYRRTIPTGSIQSRIVYRHGAIILYVTELYDSAKQKGIVMVAENTGKTPVFFPVESIDFASRQSRQALGNVREISIDTPHLGPHPEFTSGVLDVPHQSYVYVVTRKSK